MSRKNRSGFTLIEVLIVVVIMAVLAATIIPQFSDASTDAKLNTSVFNLQTLRSQIETFKAQHGGTAPAALTRLTVKTKKDGTVDASGPYGPYLSTIPEETITGASTVKASTNNPIASGDVDTAGGWIYNATSGEIRINHADHVTK
ncbi:MAG: type II secretion system protein [Planctomycetes bacterium]|nr:type II secretion system protein [Planctomycetota bacterium]